jgi:serine phosphatase RsbU (regulator of sigma subunit)
VESSERAIIGLIADALQGLLHGGRVSPVPTPDRDVDEGVRRLVDIANLCLKQHGESREFLDSLSRGNLDCEPPPRNLLLSPFKQLHSNLRHLVWQTDQVAKGDLSQQVDFLGTFAEAFNSMIASLREKRRIEEELREANTTILEGMEYARTIQSALLPRESEILGTTAEFFSLWKPRDVIGGDLFAFKSVDEGFVVAVIDCTGHGVPGAVMTMIAGTCFQRSIEEEGHEDPARVLQSLNRLVKETLHQRHSETPSDDGLDIGLCYVNRHQRSIRFAGAKIGLLLSTERGIDYVLPDRQSVGYKSSRLKYAYKSHLIECPRATACYMATDGLTDQMGGPRGFSYGKSRFRKMIAELHDIPIAEQKAMLERDWQMWRGHEPQIDDLTCVGFSL